MSITSDKEFDKVFKDRFDSFELDPPPAAWTGIVQELDRVKSKKPFPYVWVAAASLAAVLTALWFAPPNEGMRLHGKTEVQQVPVEANREIPAEVTEPETTQMMAAITPVEEIAAPVPAQIKSKIRVSIEPEGAKVEREESSIALVAAETEGERAPELTEATALPEERPATFTQARPSRKETLTMLAAAEEAELEESRARRKIKSVGDIVNFVVGKVDKRKDKIIEFANEEEGNVVSGINLGLLQFKSKEK
ncbi:hypothetical protein [Pedobacter sp. SYSU D00535]|uniref:hypothetical protein n=1 Tax=Pedobacter sp. SYSU D00535 TaxID=2810308 RepID=UPI001A96E665|nr:hypothetical protein [Pedobacter sp. SYSU D00535]